MLLVVRGVKMSKHFYTTIWEGTPYNVKLKRPACRGTKVNLKGIVGDFWVSVVNGHKLSISQSKVIGNPKRHKSPTISPKNQKGKKRL